MKQLQFLKYSISLLLVLALWGQSNAQQDTVVVKRKAQKIGLYSVRVGVDLVRPITQLVQKQDLGCEFTLDANVAPNWFIALESGYESEPSNEPVIAFHTKGTFAKLGFNYNVYKDWAGTNNEIYVGMRYGYSRFQQHLISYQPIDLNGYFSGELKEPNKVYDNLNGHWAEAVVGIKVEVLKNFYLTTGVQIKRLMTSTKLEGFDNLYIPGFNRVYANKMGIGFNYTIAYKIPLQPSTVKKNSDDQQ